MQNELHSSVLFVRRNLLKPKILIMVDDFMNARSLEAILSLNECETVGIGPRSVDALSLTEIAQADLAIVDEGSLESMSCAKFFGQAGLLPSIYLISSGNEELISMFPLSTFLVKPVHTLQLIHTIHATLRKRRGRVN
jgi:two-component SAPR family response regulator